MTPTPIIDMFSGTGELARAVSTGLFDPRHINVVRQVAPSRMLPTPSVVDRAWETTTGVYAPPTGQTCQYTG